MLLGAAQLGDFIGDPLATVESGYLSWQDPAKTLLRAKWIGAPLPAAIKWVLYINGSVDTRDGSSPEIVDAPLAGILPGIAVVAVPSGLVDLHADYDPLGSFPAQNLTRLRERYEHRLRGLYRMANTDIEQYELYRGVDADPDFDAAPWETFAALPHTSSALAVSHTYNFVLRYRNRYNLISENIAAWTVVLDAAGNQVLAPSAPAEWALAQAAAGAARLTARYDYLVDDETTQRADTWAVWITSDGVAPDPDVDSPDYTEAMVQVDGEAKLDYTDGGHAHGLTLKAIVRTRREGAPDVDSTNTAQQSVTADANGPAVPTGDATFFGGAAEQR